MNDAEELLSRILEEQELYEPARTGLAPAEMRSARRAAMAVVLTDLVARDLLPMPETLLGLRAWVAAESRLHALLESCATEAVIRDAWEVHHVLSEVETELDRLTAEVAREWLPTLLTDAASSQPGDVSGGAAH
jgi:hypothetical protein